MGDLGGKSFGVVPDAAKTRYYYIAAEFDTWDFAPNVTDVVCCKPAMEFSAVLAESAWFPEGKKVASDEKGKAGELTTPIELAIGSARHRATLRIPSS